MTTPYVVPVFLPHAGCPHSCIFCNQHRLATDEKGNLFSPARIQDEINRWLGYGRTAGRAVEVALYGGSFTLLPFNTQKTILAATAPFITNSTVQSIRISTRPDGISEKGIALLKQYGVATVELGAQSMTPEVLTRARRGHTPEHVGHATRLLRTHGFSIGLQLLPGLPGETTASCLVSAEKTARLKPDFVRIYPALVLPDTEMAHMFHRGEYMPLSLKRAVSLCGRMRKIFVSRGIRVIRTGIQPTDMLTKSVIAGPFHPSFGELVLSHCAFRTVQRLTAPKKATPRGVLEITCNPSDRSIVQGHKNCNLRRWQKKYPKGVRITPDPQLPRHALGLAGGEMLPF